MTRNLFSVPIFLICFREVLEAAIILSVLLALIDQIVKPSDVSLTTVTNPSKLGTIDDHYSSQSNKDINHNNDYQAKLLKRMRLQVFSGTFAGLFLALCIGAAFLAVYYTKFTDIYGNSEELWEGIFSLIAAGMIFVMGLTMMQIDRSKIKWRVKLSKAFEQEHITNENGEIQNVSKYRMLKSMFKIAGSNKTSSDSPSSRYVLFFLPAATVLREGLEAVVFIGGVSLGQPASSIPIAAVAGILLGLAIGYMIYTTSSRLNLSLFLMISTIALMYVGAGLITKAVWYFKMYTFIHVVGSDAAEAGDGPGSFPVDGYIWHLDYGNPENKLAAGGWTIFAGVLGWNNTGTILTVMTYIGFWLAVSATLIFMKWKEGRCTIFNVSSAARKTRLAMNNLSYSG